MKCVALSLLALSFGQRAYAQVSISVAPIRLQLTAKPGETINDAISVSNESDENVRIRVRLSDWHMTEDGAVQFEDTPDSGYSCGAWLRVNPREFELAAAQTMQVRYTFSVPASAQALGYRTAILFETIPKPVRGERPKAVLFQGRIGTLTYLTVGAVEPVGKLTGMNVVLTPTQSVSVTVANEGKTHFRTGGNLVVLDDAGKEVAHVAVPDTPILPQGIRRVDLPLEKPLGPGRYRAVVKLSVGMPALLVGEKAFEVVGNK